MKDNPSMKLETRGQSIWRDYVRCDIRSLAVNAGTRLRRTDCGDDLEFIQR
jgi:hypothetical protein